jgi:hypothetical protein
LEIPEIPLVPRPASDAARTALGFKWAGPRVGRRHKLGGRPAWIQGDASPQCPDCQQPMTFYGQLDSIGDAVSLADCGMIYVFVCFDCYECQAILQSY